MISARSIVINHEVIQRGTNGKLSLKRLNKAIRYASRTGEFTGRGGIDNTLTPGDLRLEQIRQMVDYGAREGAFANRKPELPAVAGQVSGGIFTQYGVITPAELSRQIWESGSNMITAVFSVPREEAAELKLQTKEQFQAVLRATWHEHVEKWGIIAPENIGWAGYFHTDEPANLHAHVHTWDKSGQFNGNRDIPHGTLLPSNEIVRRVVIGDKFTLEEKDKYLFREAIISRLQVDLGQTLSQNRHNRLASLAVAANYAETLPLAELGLKPLQQRHLDERLSKLVATLPISTKGYIQYGSLQPSQKLEITKTLKWIRENSMPLKGLYDDYRQSATTLAAYKGLSGYDAQIYIRQQMQELNRRLSNILSKHVGSLNKLQTADRDITQNRNIKMPQYNKLLNPKSITLCDDRRQALNPILCSQKQKELEQIIAALKIKSLVGRNRELLKNQAISIITTSTSMQKILKETAVIKANYENKYYGDAFREIRNATEASIGRLIDKETQAQTQPSTATSSTFSWASILLSPLRAQERQQQARHRGRQLQRNRAFLTFGAQTRKSQSRTG